VPKEATSLTSLPDSMIERARLLTCHNYRKWLLFEGFRELEGQLLVDRTLILPLQIPLYKSTREQYSSTTMTV